jgi:hypothetical protein
MSTTNHEASTTALATRARDTATRAEAAAWTRQVRAWPQPVSGGDGVLVALHETASHLRATADALDPPDMSTYMSPVHLRSLLASTAAMVVAVTVVGLTLSGFRMAVVAGVSVTVVMTLQAVHVRWVVRQGPRHVETDDSNPRVAELAGEISALLDELPSRQSSRHAKAQVQLQKAAGWVQLAGPPSVSTSGGLDINPT